MAEFKVRDVSPEEEKSSQEVEATLLKKHEEQQEESAEAATETTEVVETPVAEEKEIEDADVLSYIKNRYNRDINSVDELFETTESNDDLPEDVATYLKYKKETGRGIEDFVRLNKNLDAYDENRLLEEYYKESNPHLDGEDIEFELDSKFAYDEEYDDESEIKKRKIAKKQELAKAKDYFENLKDQYKVPLESSGAGGKLEEDEDYKAYQDHIAKSKTVAEEQEKKRDYFYKKTDDLFDKNFEGFKFNVSDKEMVFTPGDTAQLKKSQSDVNNFINSHLDDNGMLKDAASYHKSLAVAMNPEAFAAFFYEQGKADAVENSARESKNIDMRRAPETVKRGGFKVTGSVPSNGSRLVIRSNKNN